MAAPVKHKPVIDVVDRIASEAYAKGWNDALVAAMSGVKSVGKKGGVVLNGSHNGHPVSRKPRRESDSWHVLEMIKQKPGLTGIQIVAALKESGREVKERTVRTALRRLKDKFVNQQEEAWYAIEE